MFDWKHQRGDIFGRQIMVSDFIYLYCKHVTEKMVAKHPQKIYNHGIGQTTVSQVPRRLLK